MYGLYTIGGEGISTSSRRLYAGPRACVLINKTPYSFLIDTRSPVNAIEESMYFALNPKPILKPCNYKYFGYTSEKPIEKLGQFVTDVVVGKVNLQAPMVVVMNVY